MKKQLLIAYLLFSASGLYAQFTDSTEHYAGFISTGTYNRTNTGSSYIFNNTVKLGMKKKAMRYGFSNKWLYGRQDDALLNNDLYSTFDADLYKTFAHFNYWALFTYTSSYSLKINNQAQAGSGVAYNLIDRGDTVLFNISEGILYDYSDIIVNDSIREIYETWRNSLRIKFRWKISDRFSLNGTGFWQPSLQYGNDYIIRSETNLSVKIRKWLSFTAGFTYNEMSRTQSNNLFATYGLTIDRYF